MQSPLDLITLVDEHDNVLSSIDKIEGHLGDGMRHRAISVFLFNKKGQLLIQRRSEYKIVGALQWANTCCGNVRPTETYEQCALRRLREELGIIGVDIHPWYSFEYHLRCNEKFSEWEIDHVFRGEFDGEVVPNPKEVCEVEWKTLEQIQQEIGVMPEKYGAWFVHMIKEGKCLVK